MDITSIGRGTTRKTAHALAWETNFLWQGNVNKTGEGEAVTVFLSAFTNGVDKKGRVSVPAPFRAEVAAHSRPQVVVYAAPDGAYLMAWGYDDFLQLAESIKKMPPLSPQRQRLARTLLAAARPLSCDETGRMLLPENFLTHANIAEKATFAGQGDYFTMWNPEAYDAKVAEDVGSYEDDIALLSEHWGG